MITHFQRSMNPLWLPEGLRPLQTQVAGHTFLENTDSLGLLQDDDNNCVLKPLGKPACAERELAFYRTLQETKDPLLQELRSWVPQFYQQLKITINKRELSFLKLENLSHNMLKPCIMDIKIGKRTWDPEASLKKRQVEEQKYVNCKQTLGLCIPGFQVYTCDSGALLRHGKEYGKQLDVPGFKRTMQIFLNLREHMEQNVMLIDEVLRQLYAIQQWFNRQTLLHFYASSVLICYDFEALKQLTAEQSNGNGQPKALQPFVKVRMIDFAHVFTAENGALDSNYLFGLNNLIKILEELHACH